MPLDGITLKAVTDELAFLKGASIQKIHQPQNKKIYYCIDCNKEITKGAMRCLVCENKRRNKELIVTKEELKNLIRTTPFTQIGKMFNVSDNTIRKWCDKYNLPRKVSEIKQYSDEDWINL